MPFNDSAPARSGPASWDEVSTPSQPAAPAQPAQQQANGWDAISAPSTPTTQPAASAEPSMMQALGAGVGEAIRHPINFAGEALGMFSPTNVEAGLGAIGAAIRPDLLTPQGNQFRNEAAAEVMNELPASVRPIVAGTAQTLLPKAALLSRAIAGQDQGQGLEGLNAALQQGFDATNPGAVGKFAKIATNVGTSLPFLANGAAPAMMAAEGTESAITENQQNPNQSVGQDLLNIGGQAALNYLFGKLMPGQKLNGALLEKFAPELIKASEGAIKRTLLQAGVQGAEGYAFALATNAVRKLAGQDVALTEGAGTNALVQGLTGAGLHGVSELTRTPAPKIAARPEEVKVPDLLQKMVVKSREGETKGQPLEFATPEEKAQHIVNRPDFRGPVVEASKQYLEQIGQAKVQQVKTGEVPPETSLAPKAPEPKVVLGSKSITPSPEVRTLADTYAKDAGITAPRDTSYTPVDIPRAKRIAEWYDKAPSEPNNPKVQASYKALKSETMKQYDAITKAGYKIEPYTGEGSAYKSSAEMLKDVRENKHLFYDPTDKTGFGSTMNAGNAHPMMEDTGIKINGKEVPYNDLFRAVHDFFGHAKEGVGFGPRGEENAWRQHMQMYSEEAKPAMTAETRGQNSWVNYGPKGEANRTNPENTTFAEQKAVIAPDWVIKEGATPEKKAAPTKAVSAPAEKTPPPETKGKLPKELSGAKPRYGLGKKLFDLNFESDLDKAMYIVAKNSKSKRHADYLSFIEKETGLKRSEIPAEAAKVKDRINELAKAAPKNAEELTVPAKVEAENALGNLPPTEYGYWYDKGEYKPVKFEDHARESQKMGYKSTAEALSKGAVRIVAEPDHPVTGIEVGVGHADKLDSLRGYIASELKQGRRVDIEVLGQGYEKIEPAERGWAAKIDKFIADSPTKEQMATLYNKEELITTSDNDARNLGRRAYPDISFHPPYTSEQAQLTKAMKSLGKRVMWFEGGTKGSKGFTVRQAPDTIYLHRNATGPDLFEYLGHEVFHTVQSEFPSLARETEKLFSEREHANEVAEYYSRAVILGRKDIVERMENSPEDRARESGAMLVGKVARNPEVIKALTEGERSWMRKATDAVLEFFGAKPKLTPIEQKMRTQFEKINAALKTTTPFMANGPEVSNVLGKKPEEDRPRPLSLRTETPQGREAYKNEDRQRIAEGEPKTKPDTQTNDEAAKIVARGDPALHELINKGNSGQAFNDAETVAVRKFVDEQLPKAMTDKSVNRIALLGELIAADRKAGTEQGRAFRQRRDPVTPVQRLRNTLAEAMAVPPAEEGKTPSKAQKIDHLKAIKKFMQENGTLDQMTPENMKDPVWVSKRLNELSTLNPKANKIYEYFLASVLSGPQTQERNFLGNLTNFTMNQVINRPIEMAINSFANDPKAAQWGEWKYIFRGMGPRLQQAWVNGIQSFRAERPIFNGRIMESHSDLTGPAIKGLKGKIIRTPLRLLTGVDQFMKTIVGMGEVGARAFREGKAKGLKPNSPEMEKYIGEQMDNPDSQASQDAYNYAKSVAFQDQAGPITKAMVNLRESVTLPGTDIHPLRYMVLGPFLRIAGKLESELWKYTPLGSAKVLGKALTGRYRDNVPSAVQDLAKQVVAWSTFAALWSATGDDKKEPWITGSVTREAKDMAYRTAPPMSIRLPGYGWVSYKHLQPISGAITTMIDALEGIKGVERGQSFNDAVGGFVQKVKQRVQDQTFLQSLGDFLDALDSTDKATSFLTNFGASWVPNLIRQPLYQAQSTVKEGKTLADTSPYDQLARRALPGVFSALPRVTPWGKEVTKPGTALERMLNPFARYDEDMNPADKVIAKYNQKFPETPYYVNVPSPTIKVDDKFQKMTEQEYYTFLRLSGLLADKAVRNNPRVRDGVADAHTVDQIQKLRQRALDQAGDQIKAALHYKNKGRQDRYDAILKRANDAISRMEK